MTLCDVQRKDTWKRNVWEKWLQNLVLFLQVNQRISCVVCSVKIDEMNLSTCAVLYHKLSTYAVLYHKLSVWAVLYHRLLTYTVYHKLSICFLLYYKLSTYVVLYFALSICFLCTKIVNLRGVVLRIINLFSMYQNYQLTSCCTSHYQLTSMTWLWKQKSRTTSTTTTGRARVSSNQARTESDVAASYVTQALYPRFFILISNSLHVFHRDHVTQPRLLSIFNLWLGLLTISRGVSICVMCVLRF